MTNTGFDLDTNPQSAENFQVLSKILDNEGQNFMGSKRLQRHAMGGRNNRLHIIPDSEGIP